MTAAFSFTPRVLREHSNHHFSYGSWILTTRELKPKRKLVRINSSYNWYTGMQLLSVARGVLSTDPGSGSHLLDHGEGSFPQYSSMSLGVACCPREEGWAGTVHVQALLPNSPTRCISGGMPNCVGDSEMLHNRALSEEKKHWERVLPYPMTPAHTSNKQKMHLKKRHHGQQWFKTCKEWRNRRYNEKTL